MKTIVFFLIMIVVAFIFISGTKAASKKMVLFRGKIIDVVLVVYIALLIIGTFVTFGFAMKADSPQGERTISDMEMARAKEAGEKFFDYLETGMLADADGVYVNKEWHLPYKNNRLIVTGSVIAADPISVFIEKKPSNDDQIDIVQYMTRSITDGYDYSEHLKPPKITVNDQGIQIDRSESTTIKLARFTKEFPIRQFTDEQYSTGRFLDGVESVWGQNVLYFRVPASMEVVQGDGVTLQVVDFGR